MRGWLAEMTEQQTPASAEDHWSTLAESNPGAAEAFALGLARAGNPLAKFFQFTNTALGKAVADPKRYLSGPTPAGEKYIPDTAILHPPRENAPMDEYVEWRRKGGGAR
jgi:hypothetical protein